MRDLVLAAIVFGSLPFIFKRPHVGLLMCVWLSVMNPHKLAWGFFSYNVPYVALVAGCTIFSAMMHASEVKRPPMSSMIIWLALFVFWTCVTTFFALDQGESFVLWKTIIKTQVIAFLIPLLIHTKERLQQLIWVIALSIVYYGAKGGLWILLTGGGERVYGPSGSYIEDNNALAVAVIMMIPLLR